MVTGAVAVVRHHGPLTLWNQLDTQWYIGIARHGYHWSINGKPALAFFPLYPLLISLCTHLGLDALVAGLVISNVAFLGALVYLYHLVAAEWGDTIAVRSVWLIALFPTALFCFAPYTESLFLLTAAGALYHGRRGQWWRAGLLAGACVATRSSGLAILPALMLMASTTRPTTWFKLIGPPVASITAFALCLWSQGLSISVMLHAQRSWHRSLTVPWTGFSASISWLVREGTTNIPWAIENVLQLGVTCIFLLLTILAWRTLSPPLAVYCAFFWLMVLTSPEWMDDYYAPFSSMTRFVLALFPLAPWVASTLSTQRLKVWLALSGMLLGGCTVVHLAGGWVG
jgi:Gpi18-like mannosyltransferase